MEDRLHGVIELGKTPDGPEERLQKVRDWLDGRDDVERYVVGNMFDLWYGPFDDIDTIGDTLSVRRGAPNPASNIQES